MAQNLKPALPNTWLLSSAFPLVVFRGYFSQARHDKALILAWAVFGMSLLQVILLAESGQALSYGNFTWGSQYALFILFVLSVRFWFQQRNLENKRRQLIYIMVYGIHVGFGIVSFISWLRVPMV